MTVRVTRLPSDRDAAYASFVADHPDAQISYTLAYRDLLTELLGCQARYAVALRGEAVVGVMPLMSFEGVAGTVLNSLPYFGSNGGPLADDAEACDALCAWYAEEAQAPGIVAATVIANPFAARAPSVVHDVTDVRIAHVTSLTGDGDAHDRIWAAIDGSARRNVGKAQRCGTVVAVENASLADLEHLHRRSMAAIGASIKSHEFFAGVQRHFQPGIDFDLYVARIGGEAVAALLVFYCAKTVDYYVPAVSPEHRSEQPMAAILLQAMSDAARSGRVRWNWGGSWPSHESLQRFKAKWGGAPCEYRYETKLNDRSLLQASQQDLLTAYPGFYVVPFSCLTPVPGGIANDVGSG